MPFLAATLLSAGFFLSELSLAIWRRTSSKKSFAERDAGSLRVLWVVISASIMAGWSCAVQHVGPPLPIGSSWFGAALFALGTLLRWWSIQHLGQFFTVNVAVSQNHLVVDTGPYRFVRHPSYTGLLLQLTGLGLCLGTLLSPLFMLVPPLLALLYRVRVEEKALHAHLGDAYAGYSARTKKFVPLVF